MVWYYGGCQPCIVEAKTENGRMGRIVNFCIERIDPAEYGQYSWRWRRVVLEPGVWCFDAIVNAIIREEYPQERMEAVQNNFLADPTDDNAIKEMREMQDWRKYAKRVAKVALLHKFNR